MKKLSFILAIVLATSFAMAQKTTWVNQGGYGNVANVTQDASASLISTSIYASQVGNWNTLNSDQMGINNYVELAQGGANNIANMLQRTFDHGSNSGLVNQDGVSNTANLTQKGSPVLIFGDLSTNKSVAYQTGTYGTFNLAQGPTTGSVLTLAYEPSNSSYLTQSGYGNVAGLTQDGLQNYSEITQSMGSNWNTASLAQTNPILGVNPTDVSSSWQWGANNKINVFQTQADGKLTSEQTANSYQSGVSNTTNIEQVSLDTQKAIATEEGTYDTLNVYQHN